ncbi:hypothetical protein [Pararobbsia alpina]|uniref:hypothetical protein n=1 Tax=Pararobbsia alpina TaxID=621374 RepID=UPI0039A58CE3
MTTKNDTIRTANEIHGQLFTVLNDVSVPTFSTITGMDGKYGPAETQEHVAMVFMRYPNGAPCVEVELYLLDLLNSGLRVDRRGGSVRQEAVKLSPLVRYCYAHRKNFCEMRSSDFADMLNKLLNEKKEETEKLAREANQVIEISQACVRFFTWLQESLLPHRSIVGLIDEPHQILLREHEAVDFQKRRRAYRIFSLNPAPSTPQKKTPMPSESISKLWQATENIGNPHKQPARYRQRFADEADFLTHITFRMRTLKMILELMNAVPCRPGELANMSLSQNQIAMKQDKSIVLMTEKRESGAKRKIAVPMRIIIDLQVYIEVHRARMIKTLDRGGTFRATDSLFINTLGRPLLKESLTTDFRRLCGRASLNVRTCLSMFRHRGITTLVATHLQEFLSGADDAVVATLADSNYSTLLQKVAAITGHKHWESLVPYIHLAWAELGAFDAIEATTRLNVLMEAVMHNLAPELDAIKSTSPAKQAAYLRERLEYFELATKEMKDALDACRRVKAHPLPALTRHLAV